MKQIFLRNKGSFVIVDDEDFDWLSKYHWIEHCNGYAFRLPPRQRGKERNQIFMHREILRVPKGMFSDHINGNRLDNRRINLRIATSSQNNANKRISIHNKLGVKGVRFDKDRNKFRARAKINGKEVHAGRFNTLEEAKEAYRKVATELHGEFARFE